MTVDIFEAQKKLAEYFRSEEFIKNNPRFFENMKKSTAQALMQSLEIRFKTDWLGKP